jgi:hypothetical protein
MQRPVRRVLAASLLLAAGGQAPALTGDQEAACGAILCLVGGSGVAACAPYLARYFAIDAANPARLIEKRLDFLNLCPAPDLPGDVRPMLARHGATCQPTRLTSYLNALIRSCEMRGGAGDDCAPRGDEWRICASFYDHGYTVYEPPVLDEDCTRERDGDGGWERVCTYRWVTAALPAGPAGEGGTP